MTDVYLAVGHGIEPNGVYDPGATAPDRTQEHTLATAVCTAAAAALTRAGASFVWESNAGAGHDPDYRGSVDIVNRIMPKLAIEVHFDSFNAPRGGFGIWVSDSGKKCAEGIDKRFGAAGLPVRGSYRDVRGLWFLKGTKTTAVIYECDRTMAQPDMSVLIRMGEAVAAGILDYLGVSQAPLVPHVGGPVQKDMDVHILGNIVSTLSPLEGGLLQLTDLGYIYAWNGALYHGGPAAQDKEIGWTAGHRVAAKLRPPNTAEDPRLVGPHYCVIDTADEVYNY